MDMELEQIPLPVLSPGETILWRGKPQKKGFIATSALTMMPIALLWLCFDSAFLMSALSGDAPWFVLPFMLVHMMPVWIWLVQTLTALRRWKNTAYFVTNRQIIIRSGFWSVNETSLFFKDLRNVQLHIGFLDKLFGTGDIQFDSCIVDPNGRSAGASFETLADAKPVYERVQRIILDIQTDMAYPNALRPAENPGYHTNYQP